MQSSVLVDKNNIFFFKFFYFFTVQQEQMSSGSQMSIRGTAHFKDKKRSLCGNNTMRVTLTHAKNLNRKERFPKLDSKNLWVLGV